MSSKSHHSREFVLAGLWLSGAVFLAVVALVSLGSQGQIFTNISVAFVGGLGFHYLAQHRWKVDAGRQSFRALLVEHGKLLTAQAMVLQYSSAQASHARSIEALDGDLSLLRQDILRRKRGRTPEEDRIINDLEAKIAQKDGIRIRWIDELRELDRKRDEAVWSMRGSERRLALTDDNEHRGQLRRKILLAYDAVAEPRSKFVQEAIDAARRLEDDIRSAAQLRKDP